MSASVHSESKPMEGEELPPLSVSRGSYRLPKVDDTVPAPRPGGRAYRATKRVFDIIFSAVMVVVCAIPISVLCVIIRMESRGCPIFKQERIGRLGRPIAIYKLRTMVKDADRNPGAYLTADQLEQWEREQKIDHDPRITRIGGILRRTSLDELPQFLNVLKGDLSVIGPRPVTLDETYEYGEARDLVLSVKPGITGWWQVTERNNATWSSGQRQALEVFYVRHASLSMDARVFARTFKAMFGGK